MTNPYEIAAHQAGWILKSDGYFERCASDEPERLWLHGNWKDLCDFADIKLLAPNDIENERNSFLHSYVIAGGHKPLTSDGNGGYADPILQAAWLGWQARAEWQRHLEQTKTLVDGLMATL